VGPIMRSLFFRRAAALVASILLASCATAPPPAPPAPPKAPTAQDVFDAVAPGVVAVLNDDSADREEELKEVEKSLGDESRAPKHVIDVSLRKEPMPHGTGFMIAGGQIVTAAHVVIRPDRLKLTTRKGQTVGADLVRIDEVRDIAILQPKEPLKDVPALALDERDPRVGEPVWAMGHTGRGIWALSWGMSSGIASGVVDMLGTKLILFDAPVYPGFSGGPVVTLDEAGKPKVIGINHAILFTGLAGAFAPIGSISSAVVASELREVAAGHPHPLQVALAEYAKKQRARVYADLFITDNLSVSRDANDQPVAFIAGNAKSIEATPDGTRVPCAAMLFGLPPGEQDIDFELRDPSDAVVAQDFKMIQVAEGQRVSFAGTAMHFSPKTHGKYSVVAKREGKEIGRSSVSLSLPNDDNELVDEGEADTVDDGDPDVDVVVAQLGNDDPLILSGIRASWTERSYPRRVDFTWFARATRGWSGQNVTVSAFVLDEDGNVAGRADSCFFSELRPEHTWSCVGSGSSPALVRKQGHYDIVFAVNNRPVSWWPMEAALKKDPLPGSDMDRWMKEMRRLKAAKDKPPKTKPKGSAAPKK
jgi:S1-C subfamily serine protease/stress response protein SCP2